MLKCRPNPLGLVHRSPTRGIVDGSLCPSAAWLRWQTWRPWGLTDVEQPTQICSRCEFPLKSAPRLLFFTLPTYHFQQCSPFHRNFPDPSSLVLSSLFSFFYTPEHLVSQSLAGILMNCVCMSALSQTDSVQISVLPIFDLYHLRLVT